MVTCFRASRDATVAQEKSNAFVMRGSSVQFRPVAPSSELELVAGNCRIHASLAQLVEQLTLNQFVHGSSP